MNQLEPSHLTCKQDGSCCLHVGDRLQYRWHPAVRRWYKCTYAPDGRPFPGEWADPDPRHLLKHRDLLPAGCLSPLLTACPS